jgi:hypothetical protein
LLAAGHQMACCPYLLFLRIEQVYVRRNCMKSMSAPATIV